MIDKEKNRQKAKEWRLNNPEKVKQHNSYWNTKRLVEAKELRIKEMKEEGLDWYPLYKFEDRYIVNKLGVIRCAKSYRIKKCRHDKYGYLVTTIDGTTYLVHRLIAFTFIPNDRPDTHREINHINSQKDDNRIENLEWSSRSENMKHYFSIGRMQSNLKNWTKKRDERNKTM